MNVPKKALSLILSFALVAGTAISSGAFAEEENDNVAKVGDTNYLTLAEALTAAQTAEDKTIKLLKDVSRTSRVELTHSVTLDGNGHKLIFSGLDAQTNDVNDGLVIEADGTTVKNLTVDAGLGASKGTWVGTYAIQAFDAKDVTLENVTAKGGNGGILVNGSTVTLKGTIDVSDNGFGGINVSKEEDTSTDPNLTAATGATLVNDTQADTNPTIWVDNVPQGAIDKTVKAPSLDLDEQTNGNVYAYYLKVASVGGTSYPTLTDALNAAKDGDTVKLLNDINTGDQKFVFSKKNVTFDLNGCTATTTADPFITIANGASLTITDSNSSSAGMLYERRDYSYLLLNKGTLTINKGVFKAISEEYYGNYTEFVGAFALAMSSNSTTTINGGEFTGAIYTNGTSTGVKTTYSGGTFNSMLYLAAKDLTVDINGGTFKGGVEVKGSTVNITDGTFNAADVTPDHTPNGNGSSTNGGWAFVVVDNPAYGTVKATISGGAFNGMVEMLDDDSDSSNNKDTLSVTGGYFTSDPSDYVAATHHTELSDKAGYNAKVVSGAKVEPVAPVKPAPAGDTAATVPETISNSTSVKTALEAAAPVSDSLSTIAKLQAEKQLTDDNEQAKSKINAAKGLDANNGKAIVVVAQPYLDITAKSYNPEAGTLELDITPKCKLVATSKDVADDLTKLNTEDGEGQNGVEISDTAIDVPSGSAVTLTIPLPAGFQVPAGGLQVKHVKDNGKVYYYPADVTPATENDPATATFTVTHGFSTFTIQGTDTRMLTVEYGSDVTDATYSITDVGSALPTASKSGYDFNGWTFSGANGTYTTLTDALWNELMGEGSGNKTVTAAAQFTKQSSGNPGGTPVEPEQPEEPETTYKSDTTYDLTVNGAYTFLITSLNGKKPSFAVGTPGVFRTELVKAVGSDYYFKITSIGKTGSQAGIYINGGSRLLVATVGKPAATYKSDTTYDLSVNGAYTFQITSLNGKKPSFAVGTPGVFRTELVKQDGSNYYYKITSVGKKGAQAGIYINGESRLLIATVK